MVWILLAVCVVSIAARSKTATTPEQFLVLETMLAVCAAITILMQMIAITMALSKTVTTSTPA